MAIKQECVPKDILASLPVSELEIDGWQRRFVTDADRADEAIELYLELGFEVHAEPVLARELGGKCDDCALVATCQFKTIYTRTKNRADPKQQGSEAL
ncbi:MAG TPA: hypothetical protein VLR92_05625 [Blastocatellia bacterium]|nr:hypothetical protein [Blastocatellia bacterium]